MGVERSNYTEYVDWNIIIMNLTPTQAKDAGISPRNLSYLKTKTQNNEPLGLHDDTRKKLLKTIKR